VGLCTVLEDLSQALLQDLLLRPFNIPVLSWLYKKLTGEEQLTMLGALSLLAAIPVTIVYKLLTGEAPVPQQPASSKLQLARTPWSARKVLELDARASRVSPHAHDYSVVGGAVAEFSSLFYSACVFGKSLAIGPLSEKLLTSAQAVTTWISVVLTFPFDDNFAQETMDRILWEVILAEAVSAGCVALLGWAPVTEAPTKAAVKAVEMVDTGMLGLVGIAGLIASVASYVMEMVALAGSTPVPEYHSFKSDTEKLGANLLRYTGTVAESVAGFMPPCLTKTELLFGAFAVEFGAFGLDMVRWAEAVVFDEDEGVDQKLFQPW
jgi:hypothetical protein